MSYEVYIDVRHHPKHNDDDEKRESTAFKMADTDAPLATVAACLRMFASELDPPRPDAICPTCGAAAELIDGRFEAHDPSPFIKDAR